MELQEHFPEGYCGPPESSRVAGMKVVLYTFVPFLRLPAFRYKRSKLTCPFVHCRAEIASGSG